MNFQNFFQLRESPFGESPDLRFFYSSRAHREAIQKSSWAIEENKAFITIIGTAGSGKTMLSRLLHNSFAEDAEIAMIVNPVLDAQSLLEAICADFDIGQLPTLPNLEQFLTSQAAAGRRNILIIDEAQTLSHSCFEFVRLLTNLETSQRKLLQVVLIGQPELMLRLAQPDLKQLQQRIFLQVDLAPIGAEEVAAYVRHRIEVAGGGNFVRFDESAIRRIHKISGGIPRVINKICEAALRFAALEEKRLISSTQINALPFGQIGVNLPKAWAFFDRRSIR